MNQFVIDLFDDADQAAEESDNIDNSSEEVDQSQGKPKGRESSGRHAKDVDTELRLVRLQEDLARSNAEAAQRRRDNKELKSSVERQQKELDSFKSRTIRTEARAALAERGVVHKDVLDIFLKSAGENIKVDENFDVLGIEEQLERFTQSHAVFFKSLKEESSADQKVGEKDEKPEEKDEEKASKPNRTSFGFSTRGASGDSGKGKSDSLSASQILASHLKTVRR